MQSSAAAEPCRFSLDLSRHCGYHRSHRPVFLRGCDGW